jgi:heat shock protein HslJ
MATLERPVWRLVAYGTARPDPHSLATLVFGDGRFVADDGCSVIGGNVADVDGRLHFDPQQVRTLGCASPAGQPGFGQPAIDVFTSYPTFTIRGSGLTLNARPAMHLVAAPDLARPTLDVPSIDFATWKLTKVQDGSGTVFPVTGAPTFRLDSGQSVLTASDGCNVITWDAFLLNRALRASRTESTGTGCNQRIGATANVVDAVLTGDSTASLSGPTLTIEHAGHGTLTYTWVPDDKHATDPAQLVNRTWHLLSDGGSGVPDDVTLRIDLTQQVGGRMSGLDGCHTVSSWASVHAGWWTTTQPLNLAEDESCASPIHRVLATNPVLWWIDDGKLIVRTAGPQASALVYGASAPPRVAPQLSGVTWTLSTWDASGQTVPGGNASYPERTEIRIDGDTMTITHRCYVDTAHVTVGAGTLDVTGARLQSTAPCYGRATGSLVQRARQTLEARVDAFLDIALSGTVGWSISGGELHIAKGGTTLDFVR